MDLDWVLLREHGLLLLYALLEQRVENSCGRQALTGTTGLVRCSCTRGQEGELADVDEGRHARRNPNLDQVNQSLIETGHSDKVLRHQPGQIKQDRSSGVDNSHTIAWRV